MILSFEMTYKKIFLQQNYLIINHLRKLLDLSTHFITILARGLPFTH